VAIQNFLSEEEFKAKQDELKTVLTAIQTAVEKIDDLQAALKSVGLDELVTRVTNSSGVEINPAKEDGNLASLVAQGANRTSFYSAQVVVGTTYSQLAAQAVPDGFKVVLYADSDNTGEIAYGTSSLVAVGTNAGLKAGQGVRLQVDNVNRIYVIASAAGQILNVTVEI
jgi:ribosomal protein L12E/L44/L45/RPP1/RPP2